MTVVMQRWEKQRLGDRIADWTAALSLGLAGGVSGFASLPAIFPYAPIVGGLCLAAVLTGVGLGAMRRVAGVEDRLPDFELVPFPDAEDELLLDQPFVEADEALVLDDPIPLAAENSRVIRLFAPETIAAPGELAERIDQWLEGARGRPRAAAVAAAGGHGPRSSPAAAALHAALDDLRRSLR